MLKGKYFITNNKPIFLSNQYHIIPFEEIIPEIFQYNTLSLDTETSGLDPYLHKLLTIQLGLSHIQVCFDYQSLTVNQRKILKEKLEEDRTYIIQNAKFDLKVLFHLDIILKSVYDTYLVEQILYLGLPDSSRGKSLDDLCWNYLSIKLSKEVRSNIPTEGLTERVILYALKDVEYLDKIKELQEKRLEEEDLINSAYLENKFVFIPAYMEYMGIKLDKYKWNIKTRKLEKEREEVINTMNTWVINKYGSKSKFTKIDTQGDLFLGFNTGPQCTINWKSPQQVIPLFEDLGLNLEVWDKKEKRLKKSVKEDIVKPQKDKSELIPIYLTFSKIEKELSTYGDSWVRAIHPITKRIHPNFQQIGTDTARMSSGGNVSNTNEKLNMQNLPATEETRSCFIAEDNNIIISTDYSSQETLVIAELSGESSMIEEINNGGDMHSLVASIVYKDQINVPKEQIKSKFPKLRQASKSIGFTFNYDGNAKTLVERGFEENEAKRIENEYLKGFPKLANYKKEQKRLVNLRGYILTNPVIRRRIYIDNFDVIVRMKEQMSHPDFWSDYKFKKENKINDAQMVSVREYFKVKGEMEKHSVNYPIQSTGADTIKIAMIYLFDWIIKNNLFGIVKIIILVHDESVIECPEEMKELVANKVQECMEKSGAIFCKKVTLRANPMIGNCWIH